MKPKHIFLLIFGLIIIAMSIAGLIFRKELKRFFKRVIHRSNITYNDDSCKNCAMLFQDGVSIQERAYRNEGISPRRDFGELRKLIKNGTLIEIKTCEMYIVESMDASLPCLLPKGVDFIERLAREYKTMCNQNNLTYVPFRITSATRTTQSVENLMKENGNAIENSVHLLGKTLDISYLFNKKHSPQKDLFIKALSNMKDKGLCYVKHEVNRKCLHITCR